MNKTDESGEYCLGILGLAIFIFICWMGYPKIVHVKDYFVASVSTRYQESFGSPTPIVSKKVLNGYEKWQAREKARKGL